jgi:hypothetical protein
LKLFFHRIDFGIPIVLPRIEKSFPGIDAIDVPRPSRGDYWQVPPAIQ